MKFLKQFLALACRFDFNFSCVWLSSSDNALADAASCFAYTCLFNLAPYLDKQPSSKTLQTGGTSDMRTSHKPSLSTSGMASPPVPNHHTAQVRSHSLNLYSSTTCTTPTGQFFPHHSMQSCSGSHPWAPEFSPKLSRNISLMSDPCTLISTFCSLQTHHSSSELLEASNISMEKKIENPNSRLQPWSSKTFSITSSQASSPGMQLSIPHAALPSQDFSDVENLQLSQT